MITTIQPPTPQHNPELERQHQLEQTVTRLVQAFISALAIFLLCGK